MSIANPVTHPSAAPQAGSEATGALRDANPNTSADQSKAFVKQLHARTRSNVPSLLFNIVAVVGCFFMLATGWPTTNPLFVAAIVLTLVYFEHCWTIIFHEDAHLMLYKARWHNYFNGIIVGTLLMLPFTIFRQVHIRHHAKMNTPDDWELWPYVDPQASVGFRRRFLWVDILLGMWMGPWIYGRYFWHEDSPMTDPKMRRQVWIEYGIIVAFWGSLIGAVAYFNVWGAFVMAYLVPGFITGIVQTMRKLIEHLGLPADSAVAGSRTIISKGPMARFVDWTSFHIAQHGLHHLFPQMPHENLKAAAEALPAERRGRIFTSHWEALRDAWPHFAAPGIGVNAPRPVGVTNSGSATLADVPGVDVGGVDAGGVDAGMVDAGAAPVPTTTKPSSAASS